ncbi:metallophosphoesterase family protein [Oecophyllibacter saccharovorans]|uniref:metallophosphoesterase family protein n=1 Tax=Oecophyllibacter saccharovorans TaxID=2558360 RepID=UPI0011727C50|nr:DNA repair exonuclease [Oecophyllibacter saccharovorans]TPW33685.1 DNA repair exonuclease [Oecophyllibacter saccharovorans]
MTVLRFLHAADLHLDSPLRGLKRHEGLPHEEIRLATRRALDRLVETAIAEEVAFVILAGDLYDGDWKDASTGLYMASALGRLTRRGIEVITVSGNHDADSVISRRLPMPEGVHTFPTRQPTTYRLEGLQVALHGQSFATRHVPEDITRNFPPPVPGWLNIGVLHTSLTGDSAHATYAPCTVEGLCALGYDYWALGHVHKRQIVHEAPWIVFPGVIQGRHVRETGACGGMIVEAEGTRILSVRPVDFDTVRWHVLNLDLTDMATTEALARLARQQLMEAMGAAEGRLLVVRVVLQGTTPLHGQLGRWDEDLRAIMAGLGEGIALEKLHDETRPPAQQRTANPLLDTLLEEARQDVLGKSMPHMPHENPLAALDETLSDFLRLLPRDIASEALTTAPELLLGQAMISLKDRLTGAHTPDDRLPEAPATEFTRPDHTRENAA